MGNHVKGEVEVDAGGKKLIFRLGINELISIQDALGFAGDDSKLWETFKDLKSPKVLRTIIYHGLKRDHRDMTEEGAGDLVVELGMPGTAALIAQALAWSLPERKEGAGAADKGGEEPRPSDGPTSS